MGSGMRIERFAQQDRQSFRGKGRKLRFVTVGCLLLLMLAGCWGRNQADSVQMDSVQTDSEQADSGEMSQEAAGLVDPLVATEEERDAIEEFVDEETGITIFTEDDRPKLLRSMTNSWHTDWTRRTISSEEIFSGGPPRDGIPSIDEPTFVGAAQAAMWLEYNEPVIALEIDGQARAYPLQVLMWHEIVNDTLADVPVAVTFCPLCNSVLVFDRRFESVGFDVASFDAAGLEEANSEEADSEDEDLEDAGPEEVAFEFGTSGLLRNSDMIMYDRTTETLWQQFTGEGLVGELAGKRLTFVPSSLVSYADFLRAFPDGEVLSQETGFIRDYGRNPYAGYDSVDSTPFLFDGELDDRLLPMARVVTVSLDGVDVAYPVELLAEVGVINDERAGQDFVVFHRGGTSSALGAELIANGEDVGATGVFDPTLDGQTLTFMVDDENIVDEQSGSIWNVLGQATDGEFAGRVLRPLVHADHFWFSWAVFKPDTIIYAP